MTTAVWRLCGPAFQGYAGPGEPLGLSYSDGIDTRWNELVLGPLITAIDCSAAAGTTTNVRCGGFSEGLSHGTGAEKLVLGRGTKPAIIDLATQLNVADGTYAGWSSAATDMIYTKNAAGTEEISVALASDIYRVITVVPNTGSLTDSANDESNKFRVFGRGASTSTSVGVVYGAGVGTTSVENLIRSNTISGTVTMDASAWATRATVSGEPITFTGFVPVGDQFIVLTSNGPYLLNDIYQRFEPLIPEIDNDANNGKGAFAWSVFGALVPTTKSLRLFKDAYTSATVGPEVFRRNTSPIKGRMTAGWAGDRWAYTVFYDALNDDSYVCAARGREDGDPHTNPVSYFPIAKLHNLDCEFGINAGTKGSQSLPVHYVGRDSNAGWFTEGRTDWRPDDSTVTYATSGVAYGTELRLPRGANLKSVGYQSRNCNSSETITLTLAYIDHLGVSRTAVIGPPSGQTVNGWSQFEITSNAIPNPVLWVQPQITFARGATTTNSPRIPNEGTIVLTYEDADAMTTSGRRA